MSELLIEYPHVIVLFIFLARIADVSLGTFRTIVIFRGHKFLASFIGFLKLLYGYLQQGKFSKILISGILH